MGKYVSYYYCLSNGRAPVREFIDEFSVGTYRKFIFKKELLEEFGPKLPRPHARGMGKGLYELRFKGPDGAIRIFYFFEDEQKIIFVHAFKKKTNKTSGKDLAVGYKRMKEYLG